MKKVLSLLVAFVFLQVQSWALSGGPVYGAVNNNVSGTWAGTMVGQNGSSGLGLFQIGIPQAGLGSGTFAFYEGGGAFFGTMVALADGEKNIMSGVFKGSLTELVDLVLFVNGNPSQTIPTLVDVADMGGQFVAKITGDIAGTTTIAVGARLEGTANATVTGNGGTVTGVTVPPGITLGAQNFTLDGFEQSQAVTGQVSLNQITNTQPAGGGGG